MFSFIEKLPVRNPTISQFVLLSVLLAPAARQGQQRRTGKIPPQAADYFPHSKGLAGCPVCFRVFNFLPRTKLIKAGPVAKRCCRFPWREITLLLKRFYMSIRKPSLHL